MKTIAIVGATGAQGSSVVRTLLADPEEQWYVKALTRNPSSANAQKLPALSLERITLVQADTSDSATLIPAFRGCHAIFAATDYWAPFFNPELRKKYFSGEDLRIFAYEDEIRHGKNIADAAQKVLVEDGVLEKFVFSLLPSCKKYSNGKYAKIWHFESKEVIKEYIERECKELATKMSVLYVAFYVSNILKSALMTPKPMKDGTGRFVVQRLSPPDAEHPFILTDQDTGLFVNELLKKGPGMVLLGYTAMLSWKEMGELWGKVMGKEVVYQEMTLKGFKKVFPVEGEELLSATYSAEFGFAGRDKNVLEPGDIGFEDRKEEIETWMKNQDWSAVLKAES